MAYDIRPLSFGEILDRAFRVYLDNFAVLFGIAAVMWIPSGIILATAGIWGNMAALILNLIFLMVAAPVMQAALTIGVAEAYLSRPITIAEAYQSARPIVLPVVGTYLLMALLFLIPGAVVGVTFMLSRPLFAITAIILLLVMLYFIVCWSLIGPAMIVERRFGMSALRRSRELVVGSWWRTLGIFMAAGLIASVLAGALGFVWRFIPVIGVILAALTQAVSNTYPIVAMMIYYFDRRCRIEDFDLRFLAEQIRSQGPSPISTAPSSSSLA